jgi:hypothetical protein
MNFRKNAPAKIAAIVASISALIGTLILVQQNPPPAAADTSSPAPVSAQPTPTGPRAATSVQQPVPQAPRVRHTRTRAS